MKNTERRDLGIPYIADKDCFAEMARTRRLVQKLNTVDYKAQIDGATM